MSNDEPFTRMAERIKQNVEAPFGGAVVLVSPSGKPMELLMLDSSGDEGQFYATILTRLQTAIHEAERNATVARTFGR